MIASRLVSQAIRFGFVGVFNTAVGLMVIYSLMYFLDVTPAIANACGYAIGTCISFALNRAWTFESRQSVGRSLPRYVALAGCCYLANLAVVLVSLNALDVNPYIAQILGITIYTALMFLGSKIFVFNQDSH